MSKVAFIHWFVLFKRPKKKKLLRKEQKEKEAFVASVKKHNRVKSVLKSGEEPPAAAA